MSDTPPLWRSTTPPPGSEPPRRYTVLALLAVAAGLLGLIALGAAFLRPPARATLLLLRVGGLPWRAADHAALANYFPSSRSAAGLDQAGIVRELKALTGDAVIYLSAPARKDHTGRVCVLPADADQEDPTTWLPLARIEELLGPRHLLILDLDGEYGERRIGPTLYAASAGQVPLWSEYRGRSAFGHYVELGLRGYADADGDGRVTGRELAAYVGDRVDRWARRVRSTRQTPELAGTGPDFVLIEATVPTTPEYPEARTYPKWLADGWAKSDQLLPVEQAWREGVEEPTLRERAEAILTRPPAVEARPPARSLAWLGPPPRDTVEAVRRFAAGLTARLRGLPPDKADPARGQAVEAFLKENKATAALLAACVEVIADDIATLPLVSPLLAAAEPRPEYVETLAVARLAALGPPGPAARRALEVVIDGEKLTAEPRGFARLRDVAERAAQARHEALVMLESGGYAPAAELNRLLDEAHAASSRLATLRAGGRAADDAVEAARSLLPDAQEYLTRAGHALAGWGRAVARLTTLEKKLAGPPGDTSADVDGLRRALAPLGEPFTEAGIARRLRDAKRADGPGPWRELDALLATNRVRDRVPLWEAARELGRRLEEETDRLDDRDGTNLQGVPPADATPPRPVEALLPPALPNRSLWAWLADRYRYEARDHFALDPNSPATAFYSRAAADFRPWLAAPRETLAEVREANDPPRLVPGEPITVKLEARAVPPGRVRVELLAPDDEWLAVEPRRWTADGGIASARVSLRETAGHGSARPPLGLLARAGYGGRNYHRRVTVPLSPRVPEIVLAPAGTPPGTATARLGLRAVPGRQAYGLFLTNPIQQGWKRLVVRITAGADTRESLPLALAGGETKRVEFGPAAPPPQLPEVRGLTVSVVDTDGKMNEVVRRLIPVGLAAPWDYVRITGARFDPAAGRLEVRLRQRAAVPGPDVTAEMTLPPPERGGATYREGTLRGKLSPKGEELQLFADGVRGATEARFAVGVDGWARAFGFWTTLTARGGAALPEVLQAPAIRLRVGPYAEAGPQFSVPVEVDGAPPGASIEVALGRLVGGEFREEQSARREGGRDDRVGFTVAGKDLLFEASSRDWDVTLDVSRIRGPRRVRARLVAAGGRVLAQDERDLTLGDQAPDGVRFVNPPDKAWNKAPLAVVAAGGDPVVGVKEVFFFVGKPAMGKPPEGAVKVPGIARPGGKWAAKVPLPADRKGPTDVSVGVVNAVGLTAYATTSVDLSDDDPEKTRPAAVRGRVLEGDRPQPGLEVVLTDEKGAEKGRVKTDADGKFGFTGVAPGKYRLSATKRSRKASHPRDGTTFEVAPGASVAVDLVLFL